VPPNTRLRLVAWRSSRRARRALLIGQGIVEGWSGARSITVLGRARGFGGDWLRRVSNRRQGGDHGAGRTVDAGQARSSPASDW